ncbi:hypothetical protein, partial [Pantoea sp. M_1]
IPLSPPHSEEEPEQTFRLFFAYCKVRGGENPRSGNDRMLSEFLSSLMFPFFNFPMLCSLFLFEAIN